MNETIAIIGLGRVGLPLALVLADAGARVFGIDISADLLIQLRMRQMPFLEEGCQDLLARHLGVNFFPGDDLAVVAEASTIILTLGTPVDEHMNPIFSQVEDTTRKMLPFLRPGALIVLRSTLSPGTTEYLRRMIERSSEFRIGKDLFLAFCPERIAEGRSLEEIPIIPQIVGTLDPRSTERASALFGQITKTILTSDARSVELAKLFCNMYRYIDFAIANEFMMIAQQHGREIYDIVELVNRDYARGGLKQPGLTGGPCLYKDGFFLVSKTPYPELISTAWKINETVPAHLIDRIKTIVPLDGAKVAILGLSFKKNIDDPRNSLSYKARKILHAEGADVHLHDPLVASEPLDKALHGADVIFLATNHDSFRTLTLEAVRTLAQKDAVICDIWNLFGTGRIIFTLNQVLGSVRR
jgi:UDP-N-acetyl-D-mannosaminuronic acid dehydrogenase